MRKKNACVGDQGIRRYYLTEAVQLVLSFVDDYAKDGGPRMVCPSCSFNHDP